jgi:excisionase family DNA binding protein
MTPMEILTVPEVAAILKVARSSVYSYVKNEVDPLPHFRVGRHVRFERAAVECWIAEQMAASAGIGPGLRT